MHDIGMQFLVNTVRYRISLSGRPTLGLEITSYFYES